MPPHDKKMMTNIEVSALPASFTEWIELHSLLVRAFAGMESRIDPPSSLARTTAADIREKAQCEFAVLARSDRVIVGCGFAARQGGDLYLSKLAVAPDLQRRGILRRMMPLFEGEGRRLGLDTLTLQSRVELSETHAAFRALGFENVGGTAHPGFDRPTSFTFRKAL